MLDFHVILFNFYLIVFTICYFIICSLELLSYFQRKSFYLKSNESGSGAGIWLGAGLIIAGVYILVGSFLNYMHDINRLNMMPPLQWFLEFKQLYEFLHPDMARVLSRYPLNYDAIQVIERLQVNMRHYTDTEEGWLIRMINSRWNLNLQDLAELWEWLEDEKDNLANPPMNLPPAN